MPHKATPQLRIAVLINMLGYKPETRDSFVNIVAAVAPDSAVDFYDPIDDQHYPNAGEYDLIILSGGTADINAPDAWVLQELEFVRKIVASPNVKLVGICWGHQAIHVALGGKLIVMEEGPELGVTALSLTRDGSEFFNFAKDSVRVDMHEFHRRKLAEHAPGFVPLAENKEIFKSPNNRILTFQGHPELSAKLAQSALADSPAYSQTFSSEQLADISKRMEAGHDGVAIFERIVRWIGEK